MDIPRNVAGRKRRIRIAIALAVVIVGVLITMGLSRLKPAAPPVDRATVWIDTVKRGPMLRQVRGLGTLVPEEILWIPAIADGQIQRRLVLPGTQVKRDTILIEMRNPELELAATDAEWAFRSAEADLMALKSRLDSQLLDQQSVAATVHADFETAKVQAETDRELAKSGLVPELTVKMSKVKSEGAETRNAIENKRVEVSKEAAKAQITAQQAKVEQLRALWQIKRNQVESLRVKAGADGVLQELMIQVGQRVAAGTPLAKVAQPEKLKAELKVAETQAKDVMIGQRAEVDTHNGIIPGKVMRIDPAVINGTRTVDVRLEGKLPAGAVPDLSVDGTIELEKLDDILYVGRPVHGQADATIALFKLEDDDHASSVRVKLGRSSVNTIEIREGLKVGDRVILSDMSAQDGVDRIRLR